MELSLQAARLLEYLQAKESEAIPPTVREICADLAIKSTSTVHKYLGELEQAGCIVRKGQNLNRAIRLSGRAGSLRIPLLGTVAAGAPLLALEEVEEYIPYVARGSTEDYFALRVRGDSMIKAGILDGDIVVIRKTPAAENGEIVVALIDDEATVKRFYREGGGFRLQPENDALQPIYADSLTVLGRVVGLIRQYE